MPLSKRYTGRFWFVQLSTVAVLTLFVTLGTWQLSRGDVKSEIELAINDKQEVFNFISLPLKDIESWRYKKIKLTGRYQVDKQFLLDNQVRDGSTGYSVLTPIYVDEFNAWVLVDRGWVAQGPSRNDLPLIEFESEQVTISGRIYVPYGEAYSLGGIADGEDSNWPRRIQFVDYAQLATRLGETIQPFTLRLDVQESNGYRRDWAANNLSSAKHYGYAFQWYAMAFAVIVLWWLYSIRPLVKKE
jgi:surfeit locus 1 family protein|tara:strand:- start:305 stop:1036 length:732 start_codon:yes stop_codon:yes gene_type:complete